jgi:hypothetical protein
MVTKTTKMCWMTEENVRCVLYVKFNRSHSKKKNKYTVKPAHVVTCIKRSDLSCPVIESFIWIEPVLREHLSYKATFSFFCPKNDLLIQVWLYVKASKPQTMEKQENTIH